MATDEVNETYMEACRDFVRHGLRNADPGISSAERIEACTLMCAARDLMEDIAVANDLSPDEIKVLYSVVETEFAEPAPA